MNDLEKYINKDWALILKEEFKKKYFIKLKNTLANENKKFSIYPKKENIFHAFNLCPFKKCKVIILGQDPYHNKDQANGLCFSVNKGTPIPKSLKNIFKEISEDLKIITPKHQFGYMDYTHVDRPFIFIYEDDTKKPYKFLAKRKFTKKEKFRVIADFISGMTDRYAINLYNKNK